MCARVRAHTCARSDRSSPHHIHHPSPHRQVLSPPYPPPESPPPNVRLPEPLSLPSQLCVLFAPHAAPFSHTRTVAPLLPASSAATARRPEPGAHLDPRTVPRTIRLFLVARLFLGVPGPIGPGARSRSLPTRRPNLRTVRRVSVPHVYCPTPQNDPARMSFETISSARVLQAGPRRRHCSCGLTTHPNPLPRDRHA